MPAYDRLRCDDRQVFAPAGAAPASQHPAELVPEAQANTRPRSSESGQDGELVAEEQVLEHEVVAGAHPGQHGRGQEPDEFEHILSIADLRPIEVLPAQDGRGFAV